MHLTNNYCLQCRTLFSLRDLGVVGPEAGEVLLLAGDQSQQHDVSRGQEGQRAMRISTLSERDGRNTALLVPVSAGSSRTEVKYHFKHLYFT